MSHASLLFHFSSQGRSVPHAVCGFAEDDGYEIADLYSADEVLARVSRAYPVAVVVDGTGADEIALNLCRKMKEESFTAVVPIIVYVEDSAEDAAAAALEAGADEVLTQLVSERESTLRLRLALRRADRDVSVHPTTRLPGTVQIERDFAERLKSGEIFAVCYADLDHFKEFNDRYGYNHGDRVILIVSRILRDIVRGHSTKAFVGHIGGDDFIFTIPFSDLAACCDDVIAVFDELIPLQYSEEDRARNFFIGKDRRGEEYEVPLMTLSIGVVTNHHRTLTHTGQISELATEMKAYAKTFPGSLYVIDRRTGNEENQPKVEA